MNTLLVLLALRAGAAVSDTRKAQLLDMDYKVCRSNARTLLDAVRKQDARWADRVWEVSESGAPLYRKLLARWRKLLDGQPEKLAAAEKLAHNRVLGIWCTLVPLTVAEEVPGGRSLPGWRLDMTNDERQELDREYSAQTGLPKNEIDPEPNR